MVGIINSLNYRRQCATIAAPYAGQSIRLLREDLGNDTLFDSRLVGSTVTFTLDRDERGLWARDAWLCSCSFMEVAGDNRAALEGVLQ